MVIDIYHKHELVNMQRHIKFELHMFYRNPGVFIYKATNKCVILFLCYVWPPAPTYHIILNYPHYHAPCDVQYIYIRRKSIGC